MTARDEWYEEGAATGGGSSAGGGLPSGEVYEWYRRGVELLEDGHPAAASQLLTRAAAEEPDSLSIREALARALFDTERYPEALESFLSIVDVNPDDDYAQFGCGLAAARVGDFESAVEHLALAAAMRPDVRHYVTALRGARATLRARSRHAGG